MKDIKALDNGIGSIEDIVLMLEKAFSVTKTKDISVKIDVPQKKDAVIEKKPVKEAKRENAFSYVLSKFSNQYNTNVAGINPYVPQATYNYTSSSSESASFVPQLQTYYIPERKRNKAKNVNNGFHVVHYSDVREIQRAAKMNMTTQNNYIDPELKMEYDYWKLFSFNFIISGLVYNHVGS